MDKYKNNMMRIIPTRYYRLLVRMVITFQFTIIAIAIPSASFADINYYKALFTNYFKNSGYNRNQ